jgi:hypothetical protein
MEFLNNVTGIDGLMARSVLQTDTPPTSEWHVSSKYEGWVWKGSITSSAINIRRYFI